jgi:H+/Cl- antiporter ClcA
MIFLDYLILLDKMGRRVFVEKIKISKSISQWQKDYLHLYMFGGVVGILSGFVVVLYRISLNMANSKRHDIFEKIRHGDMKLGFLTLVVFLISAFILAKLIKKMPMIKGSGIPQVKGVLLRQWDFKWLSELLGKFFGGVLSIGSGLSLGREGPSVQLGSLIGSGVTKVFNRSEVEKKYLITSGASAGLAASFNAPLAGVIFSLEELHKYFSPVLLTCVMIASVCADFVSRNFFGLHPVFNFEIDHYFDLAKYPSLIVFGILVGMAGKIFNVGLLKVQDLYAHSNMNSVLKTAIPILTSFVLSIFLFDVTGGGHNIIEKISEADFSIKFLLIILGVKFLFTLVCYGSGVPGGIFLPMLVLGALIGKIYGTILVLTGNFDPIYTTHFIILGMAAYFTAVVRAPITGSVLILEMTGSFHHLLSLVVVSMVSYIFTELIESRPIYDLLYKKMMSNHVLEDGDEQRKTTILVPIAADSYLDSKLISEVVWPEKCLIVGIRRGEGDEFIPRGSTKIICGDQLVILTDENSAKRIKPLLYEMGTEIYKGNFATS